MIVQAKCVVGVFDNKTSTYFVPGQFYEIDTESELARMTTIPVARDEKGNPVRHYRDHEGKIQSVSIPEPPFAFQFDRVPKNQASPKKEQ